MSTSPAKADLYELLANSFTSVQTAGTALPPVIHDPNPRAINALHYLWQELHGLVQLDAQGSHFSPSHNGPMLSPAASV
jgi:hypothetical protein